MRKIAAYSCYLGLGANLGNRVKVLDEAIERLAAADGIAAGVELFQHPQRGRSLSAAGLSATLLRL